MSIEKISSSKKTNKQSCRFASKKTMKVFQQEKVEDPREDKKMMMKQQQQHIL
jgi:hypothetical protein